MPAKCPQCGSAYTGRVTGGRTPGRDIWMCSLYKSGRTLQEIGDMYDMTRERVRQIIGKYGLKGKSGGKFVSSTPNKIHSEIERRKKAEARCFSTYGCDIKTFSEMNEGLRRTDKKSPVLKFVHQRNSARYRKIEWELTFFQWMTIWRNSGKWAERGQGIGKYCMARKLDTGPYSESNVYITTCDDNVRDYQAELKIRGVVGDDGYKRLPENDNLFKQSTQSNAITGASNA